MSYVNHNLLVGERVVHRTQLHPIIYGSDAILLLFSLICLLSSEARPLGTFTLVVSLLLFSLTTIRLMTSEFAVTTKRVIIKTGWLSYRTVELQLEKVEALSVNQPLLGVVS